MWVSVNLVEEQGDCGTVVLQKIASAPCVINKFNPIVFIVGICNQGG